MNKYFEKDIQYYKFCTYGFLKNLTFFDAFILLFFLEKGITFFQIGILYAIREVVINVLEIPTGLIADSFGRRRSMIFSFISYIVSFLIYYLFSSYYLFIIAIIFFGIGEAFRTGTHKAMIFEYLKLKGWEEYKVHYYGHTRGWSQIGSAVSSLFAAFIVFYSGNYSSVFLFSVLPYIINIFLMLSYPKILDGTIEKFEFRKIKQNSKNVIRNFIDSFKNSNILKTVSSISVFTGYYKAIKDYIQPVIKMMAIGLPVFMYFDPNKKAALVIGTIYFFIYILTYFSSTNSGKLAHRFSSLIIPLNLTLIIGIILGMLTGLFYHFNFFWLAIGFFILIYVIENTRRPIGIGCVSTLFNKNILATALSFESQTSTIFGALFAPIIGLLADNYGVGIALAALSAGLLILYPLFKINSNNQHLIVC